MLKSVLKYTKNIFCATYKWIYYFIALIYTIALNCFLSQFYKSRKLKTHPTESSQKQCIACFATDNLKDVEK